MSTATTPSLLRGPVLLAWLAVALEGFDLVVIGAVIPTWLEEHQWDMTPGKATWLTTVGLIGVAFGALAVGAASDRYGRRLTLIGCVASFSLLTLGCAVAPDIWTFAGLRFLAGLGLGGCLPTALAMASEYAPAGSSSRSVTRMMTGYHVGAVLTALLAIPIVPDLGWRWLFAVGALLGLLAVPVYWAKLPESPAWLRLNGRRAEAEELAARYGVALPTDDGSPTRSEPVSVLVKSLLGPRYRRASIAFWVTSFMGLLLVYGTNTWLPKIMQSAGYELGAALSLLLTFNIGAVLGLLLAGPISDRRGSKPVTLLWFALAAVFLALLSVKVPQVLLYGLVLLAGVFVFSAQVMVYAYVSQLYRPEVRATSLGFASGIGRVGAIVGPAMGGALVSAGLDYPWGFYAFAAVAGVAVISVSFVPPVRDRVEVQTDSAAAPS